VRAPSHLPVVWCLFLLFIPLGIVISFILRLDVINTGYTVYFTIVALCTKLDPGTHKGMHSVLALKFGPEELKDAEKQVPMIRESLNVSQS
jgi:hypothetical protein